MASHVAMYSASVVDRATVLGCRVEENSVKVESLGTDAMMADMLTKGVPRVKQEKFSGDTGLQWRVEVL